MVKIDIDKFIAIDLETRAYEYAYSRRMNALIEETLALHGIDAAKQKIFNELDICLPEQERLVDLLNDLRKKSEMSEKKMTPEEQRRFDSINTDIYLLGAKSSVCLTLFRNLNN
jgi:hypothetical protein